MSNDLTVAMGAAEDNCLDTVISDLRAYIRCSDPTDDFDSENALTNFLLKAIPREYIKDPSLLFNQLRKEGNRQVCQYQFKR
jgi:hypothetical protein